MAVSSLMNMGRMWGAILVPLALMACSPESIDPVVGGRARSPVAEQSQGVERCSLPDIAPTYFPWGETAAGPRSDYDVDIDRAALIWFNPQDERELVALTIYPLANASSPEKPIGVKIEGAVGYLHEGPVGEHSAWWDLDADCNFLELSLGLEDRTPNEMDREVVKVARSLK